MPTTGLTLSPEGVLKSKDFTRFSLAASLGHDSDLPCSWRAGHPGAFREALPLRGGTAEGRGRAEKRDRCGLKELQAPRSAAQFLHAFARWQHFQQLGGRTPLPGENEVRRKLRQRLEHKPAFVSSGVGKNKKIAVPHLARESNQVEIQRAGFVQHLLWPTAKFSFQGLQSGQQRLRRLARSWCQAHHRIHEHRRAGRAIHRYGLPQRGLKQETIRKPLQSLHRPKHIPARVAQVGTQRDNYQRGGIHLRRPSGLPIS